MPAVDRDALRLDLGDQRRIGWGPLAAVVVKALGTLLGVQAPVRERAGNRRLGSRQRVVRRRVEAQPWPFAPGADERLDPRPPQPRRLPAQTGPPTMRNGAGGSTESEPSAASRRQTSQTPLISFPLRPSRTLPRSAAHEPAFRSCAVQPTARSPASHRRATVSTGLGRRTGSVERWEVRRPVAVRPGPAHRADARERRPAHRCRTGSNRIGDAFPWLRSAAFRNAWDEADKDHEGCPTAAPGPVRWAALVFQERPGSPLASRPGSARAAVAGRQGVR